MGNSTAKNAIEAIERSFGCSICFSDGKDSLARALPLEHWRSFHSNKLCRRLEMSGEKVYSQCLEADLKMAYAMAQGSGAKAMRKLCHAGVVELAIPIRANGELAGIMFAGPFRPDKALKAAMSIEQSPSELPPRMRRIRDALPEAGAEKLESLEALCLLLAEEIGRTLEETEQAGESMARRSRIKRFFDHSFRRRISIGDLAEALKLSVSRTSQLLKSELGCGFPDALNAHRLDCAARRLIASQRPATEIARFVGYSSPNYFHRAFRRAYGTTPEEMRRNGRIEELALLRSIYKLESSELSESIAPELERERLETEKPCEGNPRKARSGF